MSAPIDRLARLHLAGDRPATTELARVAARMGVHPDSLWGCDPGLPSPPLSIPDFIDAHHVRLKTAALALGFRAHKAIPGKFLMACAKGDSAEHTVATCEITALMCSPVPALGLPIGVYDLSLHGYMPITCIDGTPHIPQTHSLTISLRPHPVDMRGLTDAQRLTLQHIKEDLGRTIGASTAKCGPLPPRFGTTRRSDRRVGPPQHLLYFCRMSWKGRAMSWYSSHNGNERGATVRCFPHIPRPMCIASPP